MLLAHSVQYWQVELVETGQQVQMTEGLPHLSLNIKCNHRNLCRVQSVEEACALCRAVSGRHVQGMFSARQVEGKCSQWKRQVQGKWRKCSQWRISRCPLTDARLLSSSLPCSDSLNHTFSASLFKNPSDMLIHTFGKKTVTSR